MNINVDDLEKIVKCFKDNNLAELLYQEGNSKVYLKNDSTVMESSSSDVSIEYPYGKKSYSNPKRNLQNLMEITQIKSNADLAESERITRRDYQSAVMKEEASNENSNASVKDSEDGKYVCAPFGGLFYRQSAPGIAPYVEIGSKVKTGDVIGLMEAMKMITQLTAPCDGVISEICAQNEQFVEYDVPLFFIKQE